MRGIILNEYWKIFVEEQQWIGSSLTACMWIYTKAVLCVEHDSTQEYLKRRMLSIMASANRFCEDVLEEHEWVSPLTISLEEEEELAELDCEIGILCVVQWRFSGLLLRQDWMWCWTLKAPESPNTTKLQIWQLRRLSKLPMEDATSLPARVFVVNCLSLFSDGDLDWENHLCFCPPVPLSAEDVCNNDFGEK